MSDLTDAEVRQIRRELARARGAQRRAARSTKRGFLSWLGEVGLGGLISTFAAWAWETIKCTFWACAAA